MMAEPTRTITIRASGDAFSVMVTPPKPGFDFDLSDERQSFVRGYARSLQRHHGWALCDETMEGGNG